MTQPGEVPAQNAGAEIGTPPFVIPDFLQAQGITPDWAAFHGITTPHELRIAHAGLMLGIAAGQRTVGEQMGQIVAAVAPQPTAEEAPEPDEVDTRPPLPETLAKKLLMFPVVLHDKRQGLWLGNSRGEDFFTDHASLVHDAVYSDAVLDELSVVYSGPKFLQAYAGSREVVAFNEVRVDDEPVGYTKFMGDRADPLHSRIDDGPAVVMTVYAREQLNPTNRVQLRAIMPKGVAEELINSVPGDREAHREWVRTLLKTRIAELGDTDPKQRAEFEAALALYKRITDACDSPYEGRGVQLIVNKLGRLDGNMPVHDTKAKTK